LQPGRVHPTSRPSIRADLLGLGRVDAPEPIGNAALLERVAVGDGLRDRRRRPNADQRDNDAKATEAPPSVNLMMHWVAPIHSQLVGSRSARLHLGRAHTLPLVGAVIALYLVGKNSELLCLNVRVELDIQGALSVSVEPQFAGGPFFLAGWRAQRGT
jgi:hypothetical protein